MDGKKKRREGYTLIECLAYILISSIILLIIMNLSIEGYKYSIDRAERLKREDEIDNAILNMRKIFNEKENLSAGRNFEGILSRRGALCGQSPNRFSRRRST